MLAGFLTVVLWHLGTEILSFLPEVLAGSVGDPVVPGVLVSLVVFVTLSMATGPPARHTIAPFFTTEGSDGRGPDAHRSDTEDVR